MSLSSRSGGRSLSARAAAVAIVIVGLGSVVFYAAISATINGRPSTQPFRGWVALLQPSGSPPGDQVKLMAKALVPGGPGQHPAMSHTVLACGGQPFQGVLLMGGDARLANLHGIPALGTSSSLAQASAEDLSDLAVFDVQSVSVINLGLAAIKDAADGVNVKLVTSENTEGEDKLRKQLELLAKVKQGAAVAGINLDVSFDDTIHDRSIVTEPAGRSSSAAASISSSTSTATPSTSRPSSRGTVMSRRSG